MAHTQTSAYFYSQVLSGRFQLLVEGNRKSKQASWIFPSLKHILGVQIKSCSLQVVDSPQIHHGPELCHDFTVLSHTVPAIAERMQALIEKGLAIARVNSLTVYIYKGQGVVTRHLSWHL